MLSKDRLAFVLANYRVLSLGLVALVFLCSVSLPIGATIWFFGLGFGIITNTAFASAAFIVIFVGLFAVFELLMVVVGRA